jgi:PTH2 family peptidyl-tRNA hydrolase
MDTKQVIIWRNDLKVRTGKKMAMAAHASMAFLTHKMNPVWIKDVNGQGYFRTNIIENGEEINHWLNHSFRKICVYVNSEEELHELHQKALDNGLISHMIEDNGATEFNGVKTLTALAIGPHWNSKFEGLTDHLPLL